MPSRWKLRLLLLKAPYQLLCRKKNAQLLCEVLESKVEFLTNDLSSANSEMNSLKEEIIRLEQKLSKSESHSENLKVSFDLLTREKEEMGMQLADALLEMEVEKAKWVSREKALLGSDEKMKLADDTNNRLSQDLLEARDQLESSRKQCEMLGERLTSFEENAEIRNECCSTSFSDNLQPRNEVKQCIADAKLCEEERSKLEVVSLENYHACFAIKKLQEQLNLITQERDELCSQLGKAGRRLGVSIYCQNVESQFLMMAVEREVLLSKTEELKQVMSEAKTWNTRCSMEATFTHKTTMKLRLQLRSVQAKLVHFEVNTRRYWRRRSS